MNESIKKQLEAIEGLTFAHAVEFFTEKQNARDGEIIRMAFDQYNHYGDVEVDFDSAIVSEGDDNGAYVLAWVWVGFGDTELDKETDIAAGKE